MQRRVAEETVDCRARTQLTRPVQPRQQRHRQLAGRRLFAGLDAAEDERRTTARRQQSRRPRRPSHRECHGRRGRLIDTLQQLQNGRRIREVVRGDRDLRDRALHRMQLVVDVRQLPRHAGEAVERPHQQFQAGASRRRRPAVGNVEIEALRAGEQGLGQQLPAFAEGALEEAAVLGRVTGDQHRQPHAGEHRRQIEPGWPTIEPQLEPVGPGHRGLAGGSQHPFGRLGERARNDLRHAAAASVADAA